MNDLTEEPREKKQDNEKTFLHSGISNLGKHEELKRKPQQEPIYFNSAPQVPKIDFPLPCTSKEPQFGTYIELFYQLLNVLKFNTIYLPHLQEKTINSHL